MRSFQSGAEAVDFFVQCAPRARREDLRDATEFLPDAFHLVYQYLQNAVLGPLRIDEVTAEHFVSRLQLAVDPAVALIETARVPGQIEVKKVVAMAL